ncbi:DNA helicase, ATP-dependent, RecQ type [Kipferlia bialata]|uniref:DNA 3'-5' helicase n=1 Tax=Kipferlia bialata TaxID=797122 RepID=A0A9K3GGX1_9EUKA|nr:DNA helicase, ATP-dependent, RecQ type [Kipferlia bialata]|eukprot:g3253.t1
MSDDTPPSPSPQYRGGRQGRDYPAGRTQGRGVPVSQSNASTSRVPRPYAYAPAPTPNQGEDSECMSFGDTESEGGAEESSELIMSPDVKRGGPEHRALRLGMTQGGVVTQAERERERMRERGSRGVSVSAGKPSSIPNIPSRPPPPVSHASPLCGLESSDSDSSDIDAGMQDIDAYIRQATQVGGGERERERERRPAPTPSAPPVPSVSTGMYSMPRVPPSRGTDPMSYSRGGILPDPVLRAKAEGNNSTYPSQSYGGQGAGYMRAPVSYSSAGGDSSSALPQFGVTHPLPTHPLPTQPCVPSASAVTGGAPHPVSDGLFSHLDSDSDSEDGSSGGGETLYLSMGQPNRGAPSGYAPSAGIPPVSTGELSPPDIHMEPTPQPQAPPSSGTSSLYGRPTPRSVYHQPQQPTDTTSSGAHVDVYAQPKVESHGPGVPIPTQSHSHGVYGGGMQGSSTGHAPQPHISTGAYGTGAGGNPYQRERQDTNHNPYRRVDTPVHSNTAHGMGGGPYHHVPAPVYANSGPSAVSRPTGTVPSVHRERERERDSDGHGTDALDIDIVEVVETGPMGAAPVPSIPIPPRAGPSLSTFFPAHSLPPVPVSLSTQSPSEVSECGVEYAFNAQPLSAVSIPRPPSPIVPQVDSFNGAAVPIPTANGNGNGAGYGGTGGAMPQGGGYNSNAPPPLPYGGQGGVTPGAQGGMCRQGVMGGGGRGIPDDYDDVIDFESDPPAPQPKRGMDPTVPTIPAGMADRATGGYNAYDMRGIPATTFAGSEGVSAPVVSGPKPGLGGGMGMGMQGQTGSAHPRHPSSAAGATRPLVAGWSPDVSGPVREYGGQYHWSDRLIRVLSRLGVPRPRPAQLPVMNAALSGRDVLAVLPTGYGKSLCFQGPACIAGGITVVVSPLLSLIADQMASLQEKGIRCVHLAGSTGRGKGKAKARQGEDPADALDRVSVVSSPYDLRDIVERTIGQGARQGGRQSELSGAIVVFTTPEKLVQSRATTDVLSQLHVSRIVIDEAHCISQYHSDFRPDYQLLGGVRGLLPNIPCLCLTATASTNDIREICRCMALSNPCVFVAPMFRPNISISVVPFSGGVGSVLNRVITERFLGQSGIVYCLSRKDAETLSKQSPLRAVCYHAGISQSAKESIQRRWRSGETMAVYATVAFGMGIDRPDTRWVVHATLPKCIEGYMQEIGRAGRDGKQCQAVLLYKAADATRWARLLSQPSYSLTVVQYMACQTHTCRWRVALGFFGHVCPTPCGACDVCMDTGIEVGVNAQKQGRAVLSLVQGNDQMPFGELCKKAKSACPGSKDMLIAEVVIRMMYQNVLKQNRVAVGRRNCRLPIGLGGAVLDLDSLSFNIRPLLKKEVEGDTKAKAGGKGKGAGGYVKKKRAPRKPRQR